MQRVNASTLYLCIGYKVKHVTTMSVNATVECLIVMVTQKHSDAKVTYIASH